MSRNIFLWSLLFCVTLAKARGACESFNLVKNNKKVDIDVTCKKLPCLVKCCPESQILFENDTVIFCESTSFLQDAYNVTNLEDYSGLVIYNADIKREIIKTEKTISNFAIVYYNNFSVCHVSQVIVSFIRPYVFENGTLELVTDSAEPQSIKMGEFCFENAFNGSSSTIQFYKNVNDSSDDDGSAWRAVIISNYMIVSCVFSVLVLVVYSLLKELRNLAGIMVMAYVASLTVFFVLRIVHVYTNYYEMLDRQACIIMTLLVYYWLLSSFSWMNIMSFDIWWTLRATRKHLKTNRRGVLVKFGWYGLYGWGAPLSAVAFVVIADHVDLPGIIKPKVFEGGGCFFGENTHKYYVSCAIALMVSFNFVWFVLTAYNVWRVRRALTKYNKEMTKKHETRFLLYVKLSFIMGICRIFDAINKKHWILDVIDKVNASSGILLFILFVCKKKIILQLYARLSINNKLMQIDSRSSARTTQLTNTQSTKSEQKQQSSDKRNYTQGTNGIF